MEQSVSPAPVETTSAVSVENAVWRICEEEDFCARKHTNHFEKLMAGLEPISRFDPDGGANITSRVVG